MREEAAQKEFPLPGDASSRLLEPDDSWYTENIFDASTHCWSPGVHGKRNVRGIGSVASVTSKGSGNLELLSHQRAYELARPCEELDA